MEKREEMRETVLEIAHLQISFTQYSRGMRRVELPVIRDLDVEVKEGEMVAVVGSSGSGKSLLAHGVLGILPYNASMKGNILYRGEPLSAERVQRLRGREIVLVPQSLSYLDPLRKVGWQIRRGRKEERVRKKLRELFRRYHLEEAVEEQYPFELSGGMSRRILVSTAMMEEPRLVIADEPTPGLDLKLAKRVMEHFRELADQGAGVLVITHDLELALETADKVVIFYAGTTVEEALCSDFTAEESLRHPYTKALWRALPQHGFQALEGNQPYVKDLPPGCPFFPRCPLRSEACREEVPYRRVRGGRVRCCAFFESPNKEI
ncbi:MAG: ABC transporter ATP-binding protein [Ruminococcus sp.]|nr:ABC transporter ATP-binding protein [Ruminococcus sp.]